MIKVLRYLTLAICVSFITYSCVKDEDVISEVDEPDKLEQTVLPKVHSGKNRIKLTWNRESTPSATKAVIFWNSYRDSVWVAIPSSGDVISAVINDLPEQKHTFAIIGYNKDGDKYKPLEVSGSVYGDAYQKSLLNRPIDEFTRGTGNAVKISWGQADVAGGAYRNEFEYTTSSGNTATAQCLVSENSTAIADFKEGTTLKYRTVYVPDSLAIDTFYTDYEPVYVEGEENMEDLMEMARGFTASDLTPMGRFYQSLKVATQEDLQWLNSADSEPALPDGKTESLMMQEFDVNLYPFGHPVPADCNQKVLGDCSAIAVFAELAYINPEFIESIITDNQDDTYTIKMFDPQGKPILVTVSNKFMSSLNGSLAGVNGKVNGTATWSTILEKALMKYIEVFKLVGTIEGIGSEYASPAFTGNGSSFAFSPGTLSPKQLKRAVEVSLAEGKIVIGGFNKLDVLVGKSKTVTAHAWSFSYSPDEHVNGYLPIFVMRNPWGGDNSTDLDGQMFIPEREDITQMIDLRIIDAGAAKPTTAPGIYTPPSY